MWSRDICYVPSWVKGQHFYLYMIVDIYSRKIIAANLQKTQIAKWYLNRYLCNHR
ncbi:hypothetical protein ACW6RP_000659 [Shigella sonnei]